MLTLDLKCKEKVKAFYYFKTYEEKSDLLQRIEYDLKLEIFGKLELPTNNTIFNLYNYKDYLNNNKIYYLLNIESFNILKRTDNVFYKLKNIAYSKALRINNDYVNAFILGDSSLLGSITLTSFRNNGISHLLALSGLHVSIFSLVLMMLLKKININVYVSIIIVFIFLLLFAFISGFSPSIIRSVLFFFLSSFNKKLKLNLKLVNILYIVLSIMLFVNPFYLYNIGFILSFVTTYFILLSLKNEKGSYFKSLIKISIIAYFSSLGVSIYFFRCTNLLSPLFNVLFVPFVSFILFPLCILSYFCNAFVYILNPLSILFENLNILCNKISIILYFPSQSLFYIFMYYVLLLIFFKRRKIIYLIFICLLLLFLKLKPFLNSETYIYFIDVGQGDSAFIVTPHLNKTIMIDTGGKITYNREEWKKENKSYSISLDSLIPFLRSIGISKMDYLILTHGDFDHMGEAINLVEKFKVEKVIFNCGEYNDL